METTNGIGQSTDTSTPVTSSQPSQLGTQSNATQSAEERSFRQSEVNEIVGRVKREEAEKYKRLSNEQPLYAEQKYGNYSTQRNESTAQLSEQEIRRLASEETQRLRDEWAKDAQSRSETENAQRIVQSFLSKVSAGKDKYSDFEQVTSDIELGRFPNVVHLLADHVDNSHDILYELGKDRIKMAQLEQLALMSPKDAIIQAQRMSKAFKDNDAASKIKSPNEPLSQMRPANTGTDSGVMSVRDYRAKYRV
jgi:hypothetical protein